MKPVRRQRLQIIGFIVVGLSLLTGLVLYSLRDNINIFYSPTDIVEGKANGQKTIRVGGLVVEGSVQHINQADKSLLVAFDITDGAQQVSVRYNGILPDLFRESQGIVAIGQLTGSAQVEASQVLAKHDENYTPPEVANSLKTEQAYE